MSIQKRQIQNHSLHPPDLNLHLIAISNLQDPNRLLIRFMMRKYKTPPKPIMDYTAEEIRIEMLEDYYERNPQEAEKLMDSVRQSSLNPRYDVQEEQTSAEYEKELKLKNKKFFERNKFDLSKWKDERELTKAEEEEIIANLGKDKVKPTHKSSFVSEDEFEDLF
jgi:hypothetical protein